jgi:hypothetical protein
MPAGVVGVVEGPPPVPNGPVVTVGAGGGVMGVDVVWPGVGLVFGAGVNGVGTGLTTGVGFVGGGAAGG